MTGRERARRATLHKGTDRTPLGYMPFEKEYLAVFGGAEGPATLDELMRRLDLDYRRFKIPFLKDPGESVVSEYERRYNRAWPISSVEDFDAAHLPRFGIEGARTYGGAEKRIFAEIDSTAPIEAFPWPDPDWLDYDTLAGAFERFGDFAIMAPDWSPIFGSCCEFFGMEEMLMNMLLEPELVEATIQHITDYYYARNERLFSRCAGLFDYYLLGDDVASDKAMMMDVALWKKYFKEPLRRLISQAKAAGLLVHYHCCGAMAELIPELIELGVDQLEPCQFHLPGMEEKTLAREFGKDIAFFGGINSQHTLPFGTAEQVRDEVRRRIDAFGGSGYTLCGDHSFLPGVPVDSVVALYDEGKRYYPF